MREAYVISPSIAVSSAMVTNFDWDTSGKLLMYQQVPWTINLLSPDQKPLQKVCIWNSQTQTSKVVLDSLEPGSSCSWMGNFIAIYKQTSTQVIDPISQKSITFGKDTELLVGPERGFDRFVVRKRAAIFSTNGSAPLVPVQINLKGVKFLNLHSVKGTLARMYAVISSGNDQQVKMMDFDLNTNSLSVSRDQSRPESKEPDLENKFDLKFEGGKYWLAMPTGKNQPSKRKWLPDKAAVCDKVEVAFDGPMNKVAYLENGALLVRTVSLVDPDRVEKLYVEALKREALSVAKQIGIAAQIFAADNDDNLPTQEDFNKIRPYLKDDKMLARFTYLLNGQNVANIENPSQTIMGYVLGPGGRANVFADGSARWQPDNP